MKSCLGLIITLLIFISVIGGGALIWYLSDTAEFSRTASPTHSQPSPIPPPRPAPAARPPAPVPGR